MKKKVGTILNNDKEVYWEHKGAIVPPIYQNSLFAFQSWDDIDEAFSNMGESYVYSRLHNPTSRVVEQKIADLAGAEDAKLTGSGMGAISAAILHYVSAGDHMITLKNIYGPANNFINSFLKEKCGITSSFVDGTQIENFENAITEKTKLIYLESPASLTFELQDLEAVVKLAKERDIKTVIDNTWATPLFQKPIEMGVDISVHSVSKYLCGHSDVVAGVMIGRKKELAEILVKEHALLGAKTSPFESWLILRSLRTLEIRMKALMESTVQFVNWLAAQDGVKKVNYVGHDSFPQKQLAEKQLSGYGSLLSFELDTDSLDEIKQFVNALHLFKLGVSWGGHESLVYAPVISYVRELTPAQFAQMGIVPGLIRLSIGLESVDDLKEDVRRALATIST